MHFWSVVSNTVRRLCPTRMSCDGAQRGRHVALAAAIIGVIAPGYQADLALFQARRTAVSQATTIRSLLWSSAAPHRADRVMVGGQWRVSRRCDCWPRTSGSLSQPTARRRRYLPSDRARMPFANAAASTSSIGPMTSTCRCPRRKHRAARKRHGRVLGMVASLLS